MSAFAVQDGAADRLKPLTGLSGDGNNFFFCRLAIVCEAQTANGTDVYDYK